MDDALARGTAIVATHHGRVLQYAGDNILAAEVLALHGHAGFNARVGIHTGAVLLGGGVDADGSIRGIAVNIAPRMEQTAPAGALRISHDTDALVRGLFEVQAQAPLSVKGIDAPLQSGLVSRAKPRSFRIRTRGIEGVATRMIGRAAELAVLQDALKRLFAQRQGAAITVAADAGIVAAWAARP